jgi:hypothetical protein
VKRKKTNASWTLKPGERYNMNEVMERIINVYLEKHPDENVIVLNETDEVVYFVHMNDQATAMTGANVAMLYLDQYTFLPEEMAFEMAKAYMLQIELTSEAYAFLEELHGE